MPKGLLDRLRIQLKTNAKVRRAQGRNFMHIIREWTRTEPRPVTPGDPGNSLEAVDRTREEPLEATHPEVSTMERTDWRYLSIDEVINLVQAKLRTRAGRLLLLGAIAISAVAIAVAPSILRSNTPAPIASDAPIVKVTSPTTLPPATLPLHDRFPKARGFSAGRASGLRCRRRRRLRRRHDAEDRSAVRHPGGTADRAADRAAGHTAPCAAAASSDDAAGHRPARYRSRRPVPLVVISVPMMPVLRRLGFVVALAVFAAALPSSPAAAAAPDAPAKPTVPAGDAQITVTFTPPADNGSPITGYTAACTSSDGGGDGIRTGPASPIDVGSLTNGKTYTCTVLATNGDGGGPAIGSVRRSNPVGRSRHAGEAGRRSRERTDHRHVHAARRQRLRDHGLHRRVHEQRRRRRRHQTGPASPIDVGDPHQRQDLHVHRARNERRRRRAASERPAKQYRRRSRRASAPGVAPGQRTRHRHVHAARRQRLSDHELHRHVHEQRRRRPRNTNRPQLPHRRRRPHQRQDLHVHRVRDERRRRRAGFGQRSEPVVPRTVPDAPATPTVEAGNGEIDVTFSAPADNGAPISRATQPSAAPPTAARPAPSPRPHRRSLSSGSRTARRIHAASSPRTGRQQRSVRGIGDHDPEGRPGRARRTERHEGQCTDHRERHPAGPQRQSHQLVSRNLYLDERRCAGNGGRGWSDLDRRRARQRQDVSVRRLRDQRRRRQPGLTPVPATAIPSTVPSAPKAPGVQATAGRILLTLAGYHGGRAITGYTVTCTSSDKSVSKSQVTPRRSVTITGLTNGLRYTCKVRGQERQRNRCRVATSHAW